MARCKVIALYGGVGSGKSQATEYLKTKYHAYVIEADKVAHSLYRKNQPGFNAIKRIVGKDVVDDNGNIDRKMLSKLLLNNPFLLKQVNDSIHPLVYRKTYELISNYKKNHTNGLIIFEAALLPKKELNFVDETWYIKADEDVRKSRLKTTRGYDDEKINRLLENQPSEVEYESIADKVISNNGSIKEMEDKIDAAL